MSSSLKLRIDTEGNVGIGTLLPLQKLHVGGNGHINLDSEGSYRINNVPILTANTITGTLLSPNQPNITSVGTLGSLNVTGTASAATVSATTLTGTLSTASQPNITTVGTLSTLNVNGNVRAGNVSTNAISATAITGTLQTASQPNITSVGTLGSLTVTGNVTSGNLTTNTISATTITATGNVLVNGNTLVVNTIANRVGIVKSDPAYSLDVGGDINTTGNILINGQKLYSTPYNLTLSLVNGSYTTTANGAFGPLVWTQVGSPVAGVTSFNDFGVALPASVVTVPATGTYAFTVWYDMQTSDSINGFDLVPAVRIDSSIILQSQKSGLNYVTQKTSFSGSLQLSAGKTLEFGLLSDSVSEVMANVNCYVTISGTTPYTFANQQSNNLVVSGNLTQSGGTASLDYVNASTVYTSGNLITRGAAELCNTQDENQKWRLLVKSDATGNYFQVESLVNSQWTGVFRMDNPM